MPVSRLSRGAVFVLAQALAVGVGVAGTSYVADHHDDARKKKSLTKQIQAQVRALAPTLTVASAGTAGTAGSATNAAHASTSDQLAGFAKVEARIASNGVSKTVLNNGTFTISLTCPSGKPKVGIAVGQAYYGKIAYSAIDGGTATSGSAISGISGPYTGPGTATDYTFTTANGSILVTGHNDTGAFVSMTLGVNSQTNSSTCTFAGTLTTS